MSHMRLPRDIRCACRVVLPDVEIADKGILIRVKETARTLIGRQARDISLNKAHTKIAR